VVKKSLILNYTDLACKVHYVWPTVWRYSSCTDCGV